MMRLIAVLGTVVLLVIGGAVGVLVYGAEVQETVIDRRGDLRVDLGYRPAERRFADVEGASVTSNEGGLMFEAEMFTVIPASMPYGFLDLIWAVDGKEGSYEVIVSIQSSIVATYLDQATKVGNSTATGGFPGRLEVDGRTVRVYLDHHQIPGFPKRFRWKFTSTLDLRSQFAKSGVITDIAPDGRHANYRL